MVIHNGIIKLDYNPATDILATSMPDVTQFGLSEVSFCLGLIVESVTNYDIKLLLLDSSKSVVEVEDEAYKTVVTRFAQDLIRTRLQKIARIATENTKREEKSAQVATEIRQGLNLQIKYKNFTNEAEALDWLLETGE
jgi:hypothetical protein